VNISCQLPVGVTYPPAPSAPLRARARARAPGSIGTIFTQIRRLNKDGKIESEELYEVALLFFFPP